MRLYRVSDKYINHLREYEPQVLFNKNQRRPYIGVVFNIQGVDYYIPLSSPKPKHINMKNAKDFHKVGKYGVLNFNKMIPIKQTDLIEIDINNEPDIKYKMLLQNQFRELIRMKTVIIDKAVKLYTLFTTSETLTPHDMKIKNRCCNFTLLEQKMSEKRMTYMENLILVKPSEEFLEEIRDYREELLAHDSHSHGDFGLYKFSDIPAWIEHCRLHEHEETLPNPEHVTGEQFMLVREGDTRIFGMIAFRHSIDHPYLAKHGGHIGYGVRPLERRKGYAKAMLTLCLEKCREFGLDKVMICCEPDNAGSRNTILTCGGKFKQVVQTDDEIDEQYLIYL